MTSSGIKLSLTTTYLFLSFQEEYVLCCNMLKAHKVDWRLLKFIFKVFWLRLFVSKLAIAIACIRCIQSLRTEDRRGTKRYFFAKYRVVFVRFLVREEVPLKFNKSMTWNCKILGTLVYKKLAKVSLRRECRRQYIGSFSSGGRWNQLFMSPRSDWFRNYVLA